MTRFLVIGQCLRETKSEWPCSGPGLFFPSGFLVQMSQTQLSINQAVPGVESRIESTPQDLSADLQITKNFSPSPWN